jgi:hypothetical protein
MNQLDLEVSTEDSDELIASHSDPMSDKDLTAMQEEIKAPREDQDDDEIMQSPPKKTLNVKNLSEVFTYLEKFLNIVEELDRNAEISSVVRRVVAIDFFTKKRRRHVFNFLLTNFSRELTRHHKS